MAMSDETVRFMQIQEKANEDFERFEKAVLKAMELSDFKHSDELSHEFINLLSISFRIGYEYFQIPEYLINKYIEKVTGYNLDAIVKKLYEFKEAKDFDDYIESRDFSKEETIQSVLEG